MSYLTITNELFKDTLKVVYYFNFQISQRLETFASSCAIKVLSSYVGIRHQTFAMIPMYSKSRD